MMKPNEKGDFGEISIARDLMRQNITVFAQVGHGSKVDLVGMRNDGSLSRIQCKCTTSVRGAALLHLAKYTLDPRYNYHYNRNDIDVFALYVTDWDRVAYISSDEVFRHKEKVKAITFRLVEPQGRCQNATRLIGDFASFPVRV